MRSIKFHTENFKGRTAMVGELTIENEAIPVYEISVWIESELEDMMIRSLDLFDSKYEQEFLDLAQKLRGEIQKAQPFSLAFIFSCINRYYFPKCDKRDNDNPVEGLLQVWVYGPDGGDWLTWMESPAVADKREKTRHFGRHLRNGRSPNFYSSYSEINACPSHYRTTVLRNAFSGTDG